MCGGKLLSAQMVWRRRQTLSTFVHALEGSRVVVELRYDTIIRGLLQQVRCLAAELLFVVGNSFLHFSIK